MAIITPTITTSDPHEYRDQMELIASYAGGVHLDFADGSLAPTELLPISQAWRNEELVVHAHVMVNEPMKYLADIKKLSPDLAILHAEASDLKECLMALVENGTRVGVALLPDTSTEDLLALKIDGLIEHVLVFGGHLGYQGGDANLELLEKVKELKSALPDVELAWDGGVNEENAKEISSAGVDVLNVGGYLSNSEDPAVNYQKLVSSL